MKKLIQEDSKLKPSPEFIPSASSDKEEGYKGSRGYVHMSEREEGDKPSLHLPIYPSTQKTKLITFYLPQFHTIPENDEWWGEGFTEWTNVRKGKAYFEGHSQPRTPENELGYYNLEEITTMATQAELAKLYGLGGFCFYFYWFAGKRLLENPLLNYLKNPDLDFPFCLCWANENWTRTWDGLEKNVLIAQKHSPEDDINFISYLSQYLQDSRYIKINNKPLILIYRPSLLPDIKSTVNRWRKWCRENGIGEIYLAYTQSYESVDPIEYGFDAAIEFPPNNMCTPELNKNHLNMTQKHSGSILSWSAMSELCQSKKKRPYKYYRSVTMAWDNTARKGERGTVFHGCTADKYEKWLTQTIELTNENSQNSDENIVFINAWNEWAEGTYLEPDKANGYAYLQATANALNKVNSNDQNK